MFLKWIFSDDCFLKKPLFRSKSRSTLVWRKGSDSETEMVGCTFTNAVFSLQAYFFWDICLSSRLDTCRPNNWLLDCNDNSILSKGCHSGSTALDIKTFSLLEEKRNESKCVKKAAGWKFSELTHANYSFLWEGGEFSSA